MTISLIHAPAAVILPPANPPRTPRPQPKPKGEAAVPQVDYRAGLLAEQFHQVFDPSEPPLCCWPGTPVSLKRVTL